MKPFVIDLFAGGGGASDRDYRTLDPLSRPCPRCHAAPGKPCRDDAGRNLLPYQTHKVRR